MLKKTSNKMGKKPGEFKEFQSGSQVKNCQIPYLLLLFYYLLNEYVPTSQIINPPFLEQVIYQVPHHPFPLQPKQ